MNLSLLLLLSFLGSSSTYAAVVSGPIHEDDWRDSNWQSTCHFGPKGGVYFTENQCQIRILNDGNDQVFRVRNLKKVERSYSADASAADLAKCNSEHPVIKTTISKRCSQDESILGFSLWANDEGSHWKAIAPSLGAATFQSRSVCRKGARGVEFSEYSCQLGSISSEGKNLKIRLLQEEVKYSTLKQKECDDENTQFEKAQPSAALCRLDRERKNLTFFADESYWFQFSELF